MIALNSFTSRLLNRHGYLHRLGTFETEGDIQRVEHRLAYARALINRLHGFIDAQADFQRTIERVCAEPSPGG